MTTEAPMLLLLDDAAIPWAVPKIAEKSKEWMMLGFYHLSSFRCSDLGCWVYYENTLPSPPRSEH